MYQQTHHFKQHHYLVINTKPKKIVTLMNWKYTIGRDSSSDIVVANDMISRIHATVEKISDLSQGTYQYELIDGVVDGKSSFNGVFVNGSRVQRHTLVNGDRILFGGVIKAVFYSSSQIITKEDSLADFSQITQYGCSSLLDENEATTIML
ncbi:FHA domain-containing protein [Acaryochloris marina]|uniref:FHA domain protein n=1 Tax=Acaryochloris marina (strain MBIC 11017) TaxID=329726 RepID=B0CAV9_ACAM1|nr:FHA domain-containing protein [Acaryochloris marina]ABW30310.1 FHA domain protein [Acaryochloris marina MBIC11017]